jgi:hypothetical protein
VRTLRRHSWLLSALLTSLAASTAARGATAQEPAAEAELGPVALQVDATGWALDERSVRAAILQELELDERAPPGQAPMAIALRAVSGGDLTVTIHAGAGQDLSRSVTAPARADEVPEVTALLVGNLARDEAGDLLARLRTPDPADAPEPAPVPAVAEKQLPLDSVNLSLVYPVTLRARTDERRFALELGLFYSRIGALSGVALEVSGVAHVLGRVDGFMLGGIGYWHGGPAEGIRIGGVLGVGGTGLDGLSLAGAVTVERGDVSGGQISGVTNIASGDLDGIQLTAGLNLAGAVEGAQVSGIFNLARGVDGAQLGAGVNQARGDVAGWQVAGLANLAHALNGAQLAAGLNLAGGAVEGAQAAGLANVAQGHLDGVQLSAGVNLAEHIKGMQISVLNIGGDVSGGQIGIVNVARDVDGVQLGVVNVAREVDGVSLAMVPYSQRGRTQGVVWYGSSTPFNVGVRFHTGALYVMPTFGYDPRGSAVILEPIDGDYAPGLSLGYRLNIDRAFVDVDANYTNRSDGATYDEHDVELRYRLLGGFQLVRNFGVFAGGGVRHHFRTQGPADASVKPEFSVGIQVL